MTIRFGATDTPTCQECSNLMWLSRRVPHPTLGYDFELQNFTCRSCKHEMQREADIGGELAA
jgi:hypothetical protein